MRAADLHAAYSRPAPLSCPTEVELDVSGVPDGVTAYFVGDGGVLLPPPITTIIGAEFTLVLSATAHQLDAHTFALATGVHTLSVLAHPIDPNLNDGFHPTGAAPLVRLTVSPVTLDVEALPSELRAGSSQTMPVSVWRDAALVGPVSVTGSSSGGFSVSVSFNVDPGTGTGTLTLFARSLASSGPYVVTAQLHSQDNFTLRVQTFPIYVRGLVVRPIDSKP